MKENRPCKRVALSVGPCWGNWRGFVYWDFCEKEKMHIWVPLPWTLSLGAIWNFSKEQGSSELITDYGHKGPVI